MHLPDYKEARSRDKRTYKTLKFEMNSSFKNKYADRFNDVIVNTDFFETLNLSKNNILSYDFYRTIFYINDTPKYIPLTPNILDREIEIYDGTDIIKINDLQENEIIITDLLIDQLYDNEFGNMYMEYIKNNRDKITDISKVRNELLIKYVNDKNLIGQKLKMDIADLYGTYSKDEKKTYELVIKGAVVFDDLYFYVSNELLSGYMRNNSEVRKVYFDLDNKDDIMKTLKKYNNKEELYANTIFTDTINDVAKTVKYVSNIASKVLIGILIFTVIIFALFIVSSVNHNKKDIGILRAMGAKTSDIFKIYYLESFIIGLFAYLISIVVVYVSTYFANNLISENLFSKVEPIIFNYNLIYILIIFVILITLVAFVVPLIKITKTKPIDIIYNNK